MLLKQLNIPPQDMRGVGIQVSKLEGNVTGTSDVGGRKSLPTRSILSFMTKRAEPSKPELETKSTFSDLSYSNIDKSVLEALPDDIRKEIEQSLGPKLGVTDSSTLGNNEGQESTSSVATESELLQISFSQVDPDYLAALPKEMVEELEQELKESKRRAERAEETEMMPEVTAFDKLMESTKSPAKAMVSPARRAKRGRPAKNSPRFIKSSKRQQQTSVSRPLFEPSLEETEKVVPKVGSELVLNFHNSCQSFVLFSPIQWMQV